MLKLGTKLVAGSLLLLGCQSPDPAQADRGREGRPAPLPADTMLVAGRRYAPTRFGYQFAVLGPDSLTTTELRLADSLLRRSVAEFNQRQEAELRAMAQAHPDMPAGLYDQALIELSRYNRQIVVSTTAAGERIVWINCFCGLASEYPRWRQEPVEVVDGGNCYFRVLLNLTRRTWGELEANGVA